MVTFFVGPGDGIAVSFSAVQSIGEVVGDADRGFFVGGGVGSASDAFVGDVDGVLVFLRVGMTGDDDGFAVFRVG